MSEIWNLSAICRCCHCDGQYKSLKRTYVVNNDVEIYSSMLRDTFGIIIDPPSSQDISHAICDLCINDLRKATLFKKQVLICESKFEEYCKNEQSLVIQDDIKIELESNDGDKYEDSFVDSYGDNGDYKKSSEIGTEKYDELDDKTKIEKVTKEPTPKKTGKKRNKREHLQKQLVKLIVKTDTGEYSCRQCGCDYKYLNSLKFHIKYKHGKITTFKCPTCCQAFPTKMEKSLHMATHKLTCQYCGKSYPNKYYFRRHLKSHTRPKESMFKCDDCAKEFLHKRSLLTHIKVLHLGQPKIQVMCDVCGHAFNDVTNMRIHVQTVHEKIKRFKCNECSKGFSGKRHLMVHIRRAHTGERPYACDACESAYACIQELKKHKLYQHSGKKPTFRCKLCSQEFDTRGSLIRHIKTHVGSKPLWCHTCNKDFSCKYSLRRHVSTFHTGVKKFECDICLRKFTQKASLLRHTGRFHTNKAEVKKTQCNLCKRQVADMEKHLQCHTNKAFACEYCQKRYPHRNALNRHINNIHFKRKNFACDLCEQKYVQHRTLVRHKLKVHKVETKVESDGLVHCASYLIEAVKDDLAK